MKCQKQKFIITGKKSYLNCAYMSPMLKKVEKAGIKGLRLKRKPHKLLPEDFFLGVKKLKTHFAKLINTDEIERVALCSSVSYGMANVTNNITMKPSENVVVVGGQFPSNVYPWMELTKKYKAELKVIKKPKFNDGAGKLWNDEIIKAINKKTKVISLGMVHWADGTIFDLKKIREKTLKVGALLIVDGTQSVGTMPFDVSEINPDALVCAGYKWLMGPYGCGISYFGKAFDNGKPVEESWINRKNSEDFSQLINYQDNYGELARRYNVGQQSNFINVEMLSAGINQINKWGVNNIYEYIESITKPCFGLLDKSKVWFEDDNFRAAHLFGLRPKKNLKKILKKIREKNIFISLRGEVIRVSPSVYNSRGEIEKLFKCISENA